MEIDVEVVLEVAVVVVVVLVVDVDVVEVNVVVVEVVTEVVAGGCTAAAIPAPLSPRELDVLGTAVHRAPSIVVMNAPAGRFAFVDMTARPKRKV